jgi:TetR/AcrR family transcriptional repressor of nem operon
MRYEASYKTKTRSRIVEATARVAKGNGFAASGVDQLMQAAGLSGSAFYKHFAGKAELLSAIVAHELEQSRQFFATDAKASSQQWLQQTVRDYFAKLNLESAESGCMLPALASEVARADLQTRRTFEDGMERIAQRVGERLGDPARAWPLLAQLVGAMILARAMVSPTKRQRLLAACQQNLCATPPRSSRRPGVAVKQRRSRPRQPPPAGG